MKNLFKKYETTSAKEEMLGCGNKHTAHTKRLAKTYTKTCAK